MDAPAPTGGNGTVSATAAPPASASTTTAAPANAPPQAPSAAPPATTGKMVQLTTADVKKLMDAALRMQRANQTAHPKYAQIVSLLRQYHQRRQEQQQQQQSGGGGASATAPSPSPAGSAATSAGSSGTTAPAPAPQQQNVTATQAQANADYSAQQQQQLSRQQQLQQQLQRQQQQQQQQQQLLYQRQRQAQLHAQSQAQAQALVNAQARQQATAAAAAAVPPPALDIAANPFLQNKELVRQPVAQQALALHQSPTAQLIFTEKQLEHLHNQIRAYKALCHSMDDAVTATSSSSTVTTKASSASMTGTVYQSQPPLPHASDVALVKKPAPPIATALTVTDRTPKWTRASRHLRYVGPACFDGDLLALESKAATAFGPFNVSSPWLGMNDVTLKLRYMHTLQQFLTTSLATLEANASSLSLPEQQTLRDLRCVLLQQKLRNRVARTYTKQLALLGEPSALDRKSFRRRRPVSRVELGSEERAKRKQTVAIEKKRRADHQLYLRAVLNHSREFFAYHKHVKTQVAKASKAVKAFVDQKISKAEREEDRQEKLRLKALKANDMEAYGKLVAEAKNERLTYLLGQTNSYLDSIRKLVREHKRKHNVGGMDDDAQPSLTAQAPERDAVASEDASGEDAEDGDDDLNYLEIASKGELPRQPMMLVGGDLKEYQLRGLQWMVSLYDNHLNGILADEMGLGKTIQSISLLTYITEVKHNHGPFLVVVPLSTLSNWVNEFKKWAPDLVLVVYKGHPQVRKDLYRQEMASCQFNVLLTTYEYIMKDKHVLRKYDWQYIIVDEGHRMKNAQSKFAMTLGTLYTSRNRLLLTGTPLQNSLPELWALLNFLLPTIFESVDTFEQWFSKPFSQFSGSGETNELSDEERMLIINRLHQVLRPFLLRRVKSSVLDQLPDKVERVLKCDLSGWQKILYRRIQEGGALLMETTGDDGQRKGKTKYTSKGLSNVLMQLRKVCNHPYLFQVNGYPIDFDIVRSSGKFELLDRMLPKLQAAGHRVLMFSQMTQLMHVLEDYFAYRGFRYLRLDGSTSADEREQRMFMFNAPDSPYFIFLLSTRAGGLGLNLATADTVIIFDSDWNPAMDAQAQDRAHRIGQKNEVRVFRLVTNSPVEEKILSRATDKMNMNNLVVEAGKFNNRSKEAERRALLESLIKMESEEAAQAATSGDDDAATVLVDDEINEMMALTEEELALYQRLDAERTVREAREWAEHCKRLKVPVVPQSRLMVETDVPEWLREANAEMESDIASGKHDKNAWSLDGAAGASGRKRKEISYRDAFTDSEFVKMCEDGIDDDDNLDSIENKPPTSSSKRKAPASSAKRSRASFNNEDDDDDDDEDEDEDEDEDNDNDDGDWDTSSSARTANSRRRAGNSSVEYVENAHLDDDSAQQLRKTLCYFYRKVYDGVVKLTDSTGRLRSELYLEKPSALDYPDYYSIVKTPMDLATIKSRIDEHVYASHAQFEDDIKLMVANAQLYNHPQSLVVYDALEIDKFVKNKMKRVRAKTSAQLTAEYEAAKQQHKIRSKARKEKKRARRD